MARPQPRPGSGVCACVQDIGVHTEKGSPELPTNHRCIPTLRPADAGQCGHIQQYRDGAPLGPERNTLAVTSTTIQAKAASAAQHQGLKETSFHIGLRMERRAGAPGLLRGGRQHLCGPPKAHVSHWPLKQPRHSFLYEATPPFTPTSNTLFLGPPPAWCGWTNRLFKTLCSQPALCLPGSQTQQELQVRGVTAQRGHPIPSGSAWIASSDSKTGLTSFETQMPA